MKPTDFSIHVTSFLTHYLAAQRNLSPIPSRHTGTCLLCFCDSVATSRESLRKNCVSNRSTFRWSKPSWITWRKKGSPRPVRGTIALPPCTRSSDMFRRKNRTVCSSVRRSSRSRCSDILVLQSHIFPKRSWPRFWHSQISEPQTGKHLRKQLHITFLGA